MFKRVVMIPGAGARVWRIGFGGGACARGSHYDIAFNCKQVFNQNLVDFCLVHSKASHQSARRTPPTCDAAQLKKGKR